LMLGMLKRLVRENDDGSEKLLAISKMADEAFERKMEYLEENLNYTTIPIKSLVSVQLIAGLNVADYIQRRESRIS
ncbi:MAG: peptidase M14, partial [Mesotoga sp.]|nr:peptidase M14 [Mesotoga sp.]